MDDLSSGGFVFLTVFMLVRVLRSAFQRNYGMGVILPVASYFWLIGSLAGVTLIHLADFLVTNEHDVRTREDFKEVWNKCSTLTKGSFAAICYHTCSCLPSFYSRSFL